jgi:hypothetical protein
MWTDRRADRHVEANSRFSQLCERAQTSQLMLYREIIAVCSQIHAKHINTVCGQNVGLLNVKCGGTYSNHCALHTSRSSNRLAEFVIRRNSGAIDRGAPNTGISLALCVRFV